MSKAWLAGIIGLGVVAVAAPAAHASNATIGGGNEVRVTETGSENNQIYISYTPATDIYTVRDFAANLTVSGALCTSANANTATCPGAGITSIEVDTDARNDTITLEAASIPATVAGDLDGGPSDDLINGGRGRDDTKGGSGRDLIDGGEGGDEINGGSGTDSVSYLNRLTPVTVTIGSGNDNDGNELDFSPGTLRDTVRGDIENVLGGFGGDSITGDNSSEILNGNSGNDTLIGMGGADGLNGFLGDDLMFGGNGNDTMRGSFGNDRMFGGSDDDLLAGGPDNDALAGDNGVDRMKGKTGTDVIRARDGTRDTKINCGPGPNRLEFAKRDKRLDPKAKRC